MHPAADRRTRRAAGTNATLVRQRDEARGAAERLWSYLPEDVQLTAGARLMALLGAWFQPGRPQ